MKHSALSLLLLAGCFTPSFDDGKTPCLTNDDCPPTTHCAADSTCWHNGHDPVDMSTPNEQDMSPTIDAAVDLSGLDLSPVIKHQGESCAPTDVCAAGTQCVDGYCCDKPCTEACKACNLIGLHGICSNVVSGGNPTGMRTCNVQGAMNCGLDGKCDGAGACRNWPAGTMCAPGSCTAGNFTNPSTCDGVGNCVAGSNGNCAPYVCQDATQCYTSCSGNAQCSGTNTCASMSCGKLPNGQPCLGGSGTVCLSGNCVDGYCCDSACNTASCQACDMPGKQGTCSTVAGPMGAPHGTRTCANQGTTCGGYCDGTKTTCSYPGNAITCGSTCTSSTQLQRSGCDGAGSCMMHAAMTCPGGYTCTGSACLTSCSGSGNCAPGFSCSGGACAKTCVYDGTDNYDNGCVYGP